MIDYNLYRGIVYLHVFGVFVFLLAHGASASVAFRLKKEGNREKIGALLDLSASSYKGMAVGFLLILATGVTLGIASEWWRFAWFWTALILLFALAGVMTPFATSRYGKVRRALGLKLPMGAKPTAEAPTPMTDEELDKALGSINPWALMIVGMGGIAAIQWLMMFKPF